MVVYAKLLISITKLLQNYYKITIHETCAFDAVLHLVASGIASIKSYDDKIKFSENRTINLAVSILHAGKIMINHYKERAKILLDLSLFSDALTIYP